MILDGIAYYGGSVQPALDDPYLASKVTFWECNGQIARLGAIPSR
jgi:hypothetical protein